MLVLKKSLSLVEPFLKPPQELSDHNTTPIKGPLNSLGAMGWWK
jgi:hypothetical protein